MLDESKQVYEWLAGLCVLDAAVRAFTRDENSPLPERLIDALFAADAARGDRHE